MKVFPTVVLLILSAARLNAGTTEAESAVFAFDTRDSTGTTEAVSGVFDLNARDAETGGGASWAFVLDTTGTVSQSVEIAGIVSSADGLPVPGALLELKRYAGVFWSGTSGADGSFTIPTQVAAEYTLVVTKDGWLPRFVPVSGSGGLWLPVVLGGDAEIPALVDVNRTATTGEKGTATASGNLRAWDGSSWQSSPPDPAKPTVVITHGWNGSSENDWVKTMAWLVAHNASGPAPNVIAWDWSGEASGVLPIGKIDRACIEGEDLGEALLAELGGGYGQPVHFIGHSLGTIVNKHACDHLYGPGGWNAALTEPHLTLLDEAEIASVFGTEAITSAVVASAMANLQTGLIAGGLKAARNWKNPISNHAVWIDNYVSCVGWQHDEAVNVCLLAPCLSLGPTPLDLPGQFIDAHAYSHLWYRNTIQDGTANNGFQWSVAGGASIPPAGNGFAPDDVWWEDLDSSAASDVSLSFPDLGAAGSLLIASGIQANCGFPAVRGAGLELWRESGAVTHGVAQGLSWVGGQVLNTMDKAGNVTISAVQKTGLWLDASADAAVDWFSSVNPGAVLDGSLTGSVWRVVLRTPETAPAPLAVRSIQSPSGLATDMEPGVWFTAAVPKDAAFLAFDFTVMGDPADDVISCAVGGENVFSLPARFVEPAEISSTDMIDVSQHAGQEVEFYFGLTGGTSQGCELAIEGVRFISVPVPAMEIERSAGGVRVSWPVSATGWHPEASSTLQAEDWTPLPDDAALIEDGKAVMERDADGPRMFYRLKKEGE